VPCAITVDQRSESYIKSKSQACRSCKYDSHDCGRNVNVVRALCIKWGYVCFASTVIDIVIDRMCYVRARIALYSTCGRKHKRTWKMRTRCSSVLMKICGSWYRCIVIFRFAWFLCILVSLIILAIIITQRYRGFGCAELERQFIGVQTYVPLWQWTPAQHARHPSGSVISNQSSLMTHVATVSLMPEVGFCNSAWLQCWRTS
jgi:hypothetical protein